MLLDFVAGLPISTLMYEASIKKNDYRVIRGGTMEDRSKIFEMIHEVAQTSQRRKGQK
jgi:hypothetical protein